MAFWHKGSCTVLFWPRTVFHNWTCSEGWLIIYVEICCSITKKSLIIKPLKEWPKLHLWDRYFKKKNGKSLMMSKPPRWQLDYT